MTEEWKPIPDFPGYEVSNHGRVRSKLPNCGGRPLHRLKDGWLYLEPSPDPRGYIIVHLSRDRCSHAFRLSRLVAKAFIPNPENLPEVNHKFGIKIDNQAWNLEWITKSGNQKHAYRTGLKLPSKWDRSGEENGRAILTAEAVLEIRTGPKMSRQKWAEKFGVTVHTISYVRKKTSWKGN